MASAVRLPPLGTLRAFEAAARLRSFSAAASEICVTPSAVSHQIRALERALARSLFVRRGPQVELTADGAFLADEIRRSLQQIAGAVHALAVRDSGERLTIGSASWFAARWLLPRLSRFRGHCPNLDVQIHATPTPADLGAGAIDIALCFGAGRWPGLHSEHFLDDQYFPVCSPRFAAEGAPSAPADIGRFALLRSSEEPWTPWFRAAGLDLPEPRGALEFNDPGVMLQAAADGEGIALARGSIVAEDLRRGNLVRLFSIAVPAEGANYVAWPSHMPPPPKVVAFRDWLRGEVGAEDSVPAAPAASLGGDLLDRRVRRDDLRVAG